MKIHVEPEGIELYSWHFILAMENECLDPYLCLGLCIGFWLNDERQQMEQVNVTMDCTNGLVQVKEPLNDQGCGVHVMKFLPQDGDHFILELDTRTRAQRTLHFRIERMGLTEYTHHVNWLVVNNHDSFQLVGALSNKLILTLDKFKVQHSAQVHSANVKWQKIVFGFIRTLIAGDEIETVPSLIYALCLDYYWLDEAFVIDCGQSFDHKIIYTVLSIEDNGQIVFNDKDWVPSNSTLNIPFQVNTAFGKMEIAGDQENILAYNWMFCINLLSGYPATGYLSTSRIGLYANEQGTYGLTIKAHEIVVSNNKRDDYQENDNGTTALAAANVTPHDLIPGEFVTMSLQAVTRINYSLHFTIQRNEAVVWRESIHNLIITPNARFIADIGKYVSLTILSFDIIQGKVPWSTGLDLN